MKKAGDTASKAFLSDLSGVLRGLSLIAQANRGLPA